jgi:hypothetical protein
MPPVNKGGTTHFHNFCSEILGGLGVKKFDNSIATVLDRLDQYRIEQALAGVYEPWGI